jgi:septal ring factor EnvC (AmiA/AmiB activator)
MFLFRAIVISPLQTSIDRLEDSISNFSEQLDESKRDRGILHQRINKLDTRVTVLEEHDKWEDNKK